MFKARVSMVWKVVHSKAWKYRLAEAKSPSNMLFQIMRRSMTASMLSSREYRSWVDLKRSMFSEHARTSSRSLARAAQSARLNAK